MSVLYIVLEVADSAYILPASDVRELETFNGATPVPAARDFVAGVVHIRGRVVPVVDLRRRFGLPPIDRTLETRVVVTEVGDRLVGLVADRARELLRQSVEIKPPPRVIAEQTQGFVKGIVEIEKRIYLLLDLDMIIGEEQDHGERDLHLDDGEPRRRALPR
jgi:purine-binding chemotaxis protein CheW